MNFSELLNTNKANKAGIEKEIYKKLKLKMPKLPYNSKFFETEEDKRHLFNNDNESVKKIVEKFKNPSLNPKKLVTKENSELFKKFKVRHFYYLIYSN